MFLYCITHLLILNLSLNQKKAEKCVLLKPGRNFEILKKKIEKTVGNPMAYIELKLIFSHTN